MLSIYWRIYGKLAEDTFSKIILPIFIKVSLSSSCLFGSGRPTFFCLLSGWWLILKFSLLIVIISLRMMRLWGSLRGCTWMSIKTSGSIWGRKRSRKFFSRFWTLLMNFLRTFSMSLRCTIIIIIRPWTQSSLLLKFCTNCKSIKLALFNH
jgi:hypothetical protein